MRAILPTHRGHGPLQPRGSAPCARSCRPIAAMGRSYSGKAASEISPNSRSTVVA